MPGSFQLLLGGTPADEPFYNALASLEVEENVDLPGAIQLSLPVDSTSGGDLSYAGDARLKPFAQLAVVVAPDSQASHCIFDGVVLSHKLHLQTGLTASTLQVW